MNVIRAVKNNNKVLFNWQRVSILVFETVVSVSPVSRVEVIKWWPSSWDSYKKKLHHLKRGWGASRGNYGILKGI